MKHHTFKWLSFSITASDAAPPDAADQQPGKCCLECYAKVICTANRNHVRPCFEYYSWTWIPGLHPEGCFELYLTKDYSQDIWSLCMFVPFPQLLWLHWAMLCFMVLVTFQTTCFPKMKPVCYFEIKTDIMKCKVIFFCYLLPFFRKILPLGFLSIVWEYIFFLNFLQNFICN